MAKKYYWLKLKDDWFNSKVIKKLRKIAGGDTYTIIYLKMLLLSLKNEGKLYYEGVEESFADELALELDEETDNVNVTISFLQNCGLIEIVDPDEYVLTEVPAAIGSETESAERMRKCRANKNRKLLEEKTSHCDGAVTASDTEIDIEKDIETEKEKKNICTEQEGSEPEPEPIITLPLNTGEEYPVFQRDIGEFAELYPAVDVLQAMRGMRGWLLTNPAKRKTKRGINRFINSWLSREQDKGGNRGYYKKPGAAKNDFNQFMQQNYDFSQIEEDILSNN